MLSDVPVAVVVVVCLRSLLISCACAGFVLRKYAGPEDLAYLNWLPISERRDFNILKLTRRSIAVIFRNTYHWSYAMYIHII